VIGVYVLGVESIEPGYYILVRDLSILDNLKWITKSRSFEWKQPHTSLPLYQLCIAQKSDVAEAASTASCSQLIAKTGVVVFSFFGQTNKIMLTNGPNSAHYYRYLHWEAGYLGQLLYIEAEAQKLRATGIGCYLDDKALNDFGLITENMDFHNFYHFTIGCFQPDSRYPTYNYEYNILS